MALRCSKLAFHSCLSSIMAEEEDHIVSTCMDLIVESMRELHDLGQRIITLETVRQRMAFEHAFDVIANHKLIQRSMKILMTKGIVKKRGQWYDLAAHPEKVKVGGDGTKKSKVGNVATSTHSIELACKKWIIKSLEELENKTVHFQKLTHHMAFEHGFNIIANESLIKTTLKELRDKGTIKKNGFGYKLAENHQEKVSRKTSKEKMVESLLKYSGASCMALILKSLKELDPKGKGVPLIKFMRHMAFEHSYNILDNDALIKSTLKKLLNDGLVIKKGSRYKLFQEQKDAKPRAKLSKSKLSSIAETKANIDASTLTKNSLKALISNHALRSRSQLGLANNRHLIQRSCKLMSVKTDANPYPKQKDTLRGQHKDWKCNQCSFKTSYVTDLHRHKMMNHGIDRDNTHQTSAYVIASEDKSYLYLHKINKATMKSSSAQKAIPRGVPITPWGVPITPRGVPIIPKNFVVITQGQVKATMRSSPQKAIPAIPKNLVVITSLFGLLPPEMGLEIIKRLDLGDLDALFTAFDDLRATYLPFLRSLSYTDPDPSSEKAFACRGGCDTLTRLGFYGVKRIFLGNRLTNRYLLRNNACKSLTIRDGGGLQGACTRRSEVNLSGNRSLRLRIDSLKIVNAEINTQSYSALPYVKKLTFEWTRPKCEYKGKAHPTSTIFPIQEALTKNLLPSLERVELINYELDWEYFYFNTIGWRRNGDDLLPVTLDLSRSILSVPKMRSFFHNGIKDKLQQLVDEGRIIVGKVQEY